MATHTRRSVLAFSGLLVGGASALANADEARPPSEVARDRLKLCEDALKMARQSIGRGNFAPGERDPLYIWSRRRMESKHELSSQQADRVAAAQEHLDEMKSVERIVERLHEAAAIDPLARLDARYRTLEAEGWLADARAKG